MSSATASLARPTTQGKLVLGSRPRVIYHGFISKDAAELCFSKILEYWGIQATDEDTRQEIIVGLATAAIQGTSMAADFENTQIFVDGEFRPMSAVLLAASEATIQPNPVRVFYRSFRSAIIPVTTYRILNTADNTEQRIDAMNRYNCSAEHVAVGFDMFADASKYLHNGQAVVLIGRVVRKTKLVEYRAELNQRGVVNAVHDTANNQADSASHVAANLVTTPSQASGSRLNIPQMAF